MKTDSRAFNINKNMKTKPQIYRQGDVLIERVRTMPAYLIKEASIGSRIILAYGEATGHHHSIDADAADLWKTADDGGEQFVTLHTASEVVHQEHAPIALAPGKYRVRRQREYSAEAIRKVAD